MTLSEALALVNAQQGRAEQREIFLVCGFQPLHLIPFLRACAGQRLPNAQIHVRTGVYGDLEGNLEKASGTVAVVVEWADVDPRLGLRSAGKWDGTVFDAILRNADAFFSRLHTQLEHLAKRASVALTGPTFDILPRAHTATWQSSTWELELERQLSVFLLEASRVAGVRVLHRITGTSDPKMELLAGFPYHIPHCASLAQQLVQLLFPLPSKKGLITDLDDTLWSGIVGEAGAAAISWDLASHSQIHGLYQQALSRLAAMGVLLGVASKNELTTVQEAFQRQDLLINPDSFFPVLASWSNKSAAVTEILEAWNVNADSVIFVDDNPMELEEVRSIHPGITTLQFPKKDAAQIRLFLEQLQDAFGKPALHEEDRLRLASVRANSEFRQQARTNHGDFLRDLHGTIAFHCGKDPANRRLLELINKTNQFNLNGLRITESEWLQHLQDEAGICVAVAYEDKFGALGTISVVAGKQHADRIEITSWVLSCRAFSRKIEHQTLDFLFEQLGAESLRFAFRPTERNQPLQEFYRGMGLDVGTPDELLLSRERWLANRAVPPHAVRLTTHA